MALGQVTVFGGSGFIGRYVVRRLAAEGAVVRVAVRDPARALFLKTAGAVGQVVPMRCDLGDEELVRAALHGSDAAVNLVGILYESRSGGFDAVHRAGAERVARLAAATGIRRLVQMSAIGADPRSDSLYARSKAAGEAAASAAFPGTTILRPSIVIGPEDGFFNRFGAMAQISPALPLIGGGTRFQPVYVDDVAAAVMAALYGPDTLRPVYELGGPRVYSFRALMELLLKEIHRRRCLISVPFGVAMVQAAVLERLPVPPLTRDQVRMLRHDNVVAPDASTFADLGIDPIGIEAILPTYLDRFRPGGRFAKRRAA